MFIINKQKLYRCTVQHLYLIFLYNLLHIKLNLIENNVQWIAGFILWIFEENHIKKILQLKIKSRKNEGTKLVFQIVSFSVFFSLLDEVKKLTRKQRKCKRKKKEETKSSQTCNFKRAKRCKNTNLS